MARRLRYSSPLRSVVRERFPRGEAGATGLPPPADRKRHTAAEAEWVKPLPNLGNLGLLWAAIRAGWWLIVITIALALVGVGRRLGVSSKAREVRGSDRVVVRDGDMIGALLTRIGAHESVLAWEERRMRREVRRKSMCQRRNC